MKSTLATPVLAAALLVGMSACASTRQQSMAGSPTASGQTTAPATSDAATAATGAATSPDSNSATSAGQGSSVSIATKIRSEMAAQDVSSLPDIKVDSDSTGAVVLSGTAQSQEDIDKAMSIARSTAGVTSVRNDIKVKSQG
jgi:hyperosmotically inducible protein